MQHEMLHSCGRNIISEFLETFYGRLCCNTVVLACLNDHVSVHLKLFL